MYDEELFKERLRTAAEGAGLPSNAARAARERDLGGYIGKYLRGAVREPRAGTLCELCDALGTDPSWLLGYDSPSADRWAAGNRDVMLLAFAREAWRELKAIGRDDVFCFDRLKGLAEACGLEGM